MINLPLDKASMRVIYRSDFSAFTERCFAQVSPGGAYLPGRHIDLIADRLMQCMEGKIKRLIINIPPRNLKSISASVAFPAFVLGHKPDRQIICVSYAQDLADKHAADCRAVMMSPWYQEIFATRLSGRRSIQEFTTIQRGGRKATSIGGVLTGRGADFIIVDDPLKPADALSESARLKVNRWFDNTLISRLNNKQEGCIIIIMQRLHEDDLVGHVRQQEGWHMLSLPAIAEVDERFEYQTAWGPGVFRRQAGAALHSDREPLRVLEQIRASMSEYDFAGQYQQRPAPEGGGLVKREWFLTYDSTPSPNKFDEIFQSWDTACKPTELADYSVCTTWARIGETLYLLDVYREKLDYPTLRAAIISRKSAFNASSVLIEDKGSGIQLVQDLKYQGFRAIGRTPKGDKLMRMRAQTARIQAGRVLLPKEASWLDAYLHEMTTFPHSKHDDQVDSTSQALEWMEEDHYRNLWWSVPFRLV